MFIHNGALGSWGSACIYRLVFCSISVVFIQSQSAQWKVDYMSDVYFFILFCFIFEIPLKYLNNFNFHALFALQMLDVFCDLD